MEAIVISNTKYKENSAMVNLLTSHGILSFSIRGVNSPKSKYACLNEILTLAKVETKQNKNGKLAILEASSIFNPMILTKNMNHFIFFRYLEELVIKCLKDDEKIELYSDLKDVLMNLKKDFNAPGSVIYFLGKVLKITGCSLELDRCVKCQSKKEIVGISFVEGGLICKSCLNDPLEISIPSKYIMLLRNIFSMERLPKEDFNVSDEAAIEILDAFSYFIKDNLGANITSMELLKDN